MPSTTRLTVPSTSAHSTVTSWFVRPINSSARIWACSTENASTSSVSCLTKSAPTPMPSPTVGNGERSITNALRELPPVWTISPISAAARIPQSRAAAPLAAYKAIRQHEHELMERLISGLLAIPGLKLYGIRDPQRFDRRCPTVAVRIKGWTPLQLARKLGERGFFTWDGNYYALNLTERLNVEKDGGFLRIGLAHYNTTEEVERFLAALREIVSR